MDEWRVISGECMLAEMFLRRANCRRTGHFCVGRLPRDVQSQASPLGCVIHSTPEGGGFPGSLSYLVGQSGPLEDVTRGVHVTL